MNKELAKQPLSDVICGALRRDILDGVLKPGDRLMEIHYAKKLGVSRTPFREAIRKLEIEGLVTVLPRRGAHVSLLSPKDIAEVLDIRGALDMLAISLFIQKAGEKEIERLGNISEDFDRAIADKDQRSQIKADVEFHEYIYRKSGNERLFHIYTGFKDQLYRYRVLYLADEFHSETVSKEHNKILEAIRSRNLKLAREYSELHILNQKNNLNQPQNNGRGR